METRTVKSTSRMTASSDDLILRETDITRLIFRPILVDNQNQQEASVKGAFLFQRKGKADEWEDIEAIPLSKLKKGEGVKLELKSAELLTLFHEIEILYEMYTQGGIPKGKAHYVKANKAFEAIFALGDEEITTLIQGQQYLGAQAIGRLIKWASNARNFKLMFEKLEVLEPESLSNLNTAIGISTLKSALVTWSKNRNNADEDFWQQVLIKQEFVLEQIFHVPIFVIKSKAYMGGKNATNEGGRVVDFLIRNDITKAVGLVEIKTPSTKLLGPIYRNGIYNISSELSGAVLQVLNYRDSLSHERATLLSGELAECGAFDPKCVVIIGHAKKELTDADMVRSFELFRNQLADVEVITYDELFDRTKRLVDTLEGLGEVANAR
ncbi:MAG: DUF4263 domain-containing protein [Gammaproteobacteria bacterium]|nr:DUF4263 domain-containing protein [Gammaproteobacteria bacterium]